MTVILVSGLINIETTLRVDHFPVHYVPVRYLFNEVNSTVSGVGYNVAKALNVLGDDVRLLSFIGKDPFANWVKAELANDGIPDDYILTKSRDTARSIVLFDQEGKRQINVDLKEIQQLEYPSDLFDEAVEDCELVALCNINFSRPMLKRAQKAGKIIATDVHTINDLDDEYNRDFMKAANILFMSNEALPLPPESWIEQVKTAYGTEIIVIGMGKEGVLLSVKEDQFVGRFPAVTVRPVINTVGAGDALFSAFIHCYLHTKDPYHSIRRAIHFASYKIGDKGAAEGFVNAEELEKLLNHHEV